MLKKELLKRKGLEEVVRVKEEEVVNEEGLQLNIHIPLKYLQEAILLLQNKLVEI